MTVESPALSCPRCEAVVAADARFCMNCGQALDAASADEANRARTRPPPRRRPSSRRCARRSSRASASQ